MYVHVHIHIYIYMYIYTLANIPRSTGLEPWGHEPRSFFPGPISPEVQLGTRPLVTCRVLSVDLWESHYVWVYDGNEERHVDDNFG